MLAEAEAHGLPLTLIGWGERARAIFLFDEAWRPGAAEVLHALKKEKLDVGVLTGDHASRGRAIEQQLGVKVEAELLPAAKVDAVRNVKAAVGPVCMVGDGINDSPALAASDVGIALGCGSDVSRDSASVCLLGNDLRKILWSIELAKRTRRVIRWNLIWAFGYNSVGMACASIGVLNPALAAFLMAASSALVTVNSLRLGPTPRALLREPDVRSRALHPDDVPSRSPVFSERCVDGAPEPELPLVLEASAK